MENTTPEQPIISPSPQDTDLTPIKTSTTKIIIVVVVSVIVTGLLVGTGVYVWQQQMIKDEQAKLQQQKTTLDKKVKTQSPSPTSSAFSSTNRITLLPQWTNGTDSEFAELNVVGYNYNFTDPIKDAESIPAPSTTIPYTNTQYGFSISLPFNLQWIDSSTTIAPFDENNNVVVFGPLSTVEGGGAARYHLLRILPHKTVTEVIKDINELTKKLNPDLPPDITKPTIKQIKINGMETIEYTYGDESGMSFVALQIIGTTNNFELRATSWGVPWATDDKLPNYLENIAKTLKFSN